MAYNPYQSELESLEQEEQEGSQTYSGPSRYLWLKDLLVRPANVHGTNSLRFRLLPRYHIPEGSSEAQYLPEFWVKRFVHKWWGANSHLPTLVCPDGGRQVAQPTCPVCQLRVEIYQRGDKERGKELFPKNEIYANALVIEPHPPEGNVHWADDGQGGWMIRPAIYRYSVVQHKELMRKCTTLGPIESVEHGRDLILTVEKTGPNRENVRYSVDHMDPSPIPDWGHEVWGYATDLTEMTKEPDWDALEETATALRGETRSRGGSAGRGGRGGSSGGPPPSAQRGGPAMTSTPPRGAAPPLASAAQAPAPSGPRYYYKGPCFNGEAEGLTAQEIAAQAGRTPGRHHVWTQGMGKDWMLIEQVPEIAALLPAPQAGPPQYGPPQGGGAGGPPRHSGPPATPQASSRPPAPQSAPPPQGAPPPTGGRTGRAAPGPSQGAPRPGEPPPPRQSDGGDDIPF